jgi:hypothetical protein
MTYLIVGIDRATHARWHGHVLADDMLAAEHLAQARASRQGVKLVVAAVIGPNSAVLSGAA